MLLWSLFIQFCFYFHSQQTRTHVRNLEEIVWKNTLLWILSPNARKNKQTKRTQRDRETPINNKASNCMVNLLFIPTQDMCHFKCDCHFLWNLGISYELCSWFVWSSLFFILIFILVFASNVRASVCVFNADIVLAYANSNSHTHINVSTHESCLDTAHAVAIIDYVYTCISREMYHPLLNAYYMIIP